MTETSLSLLLSILLLISTVGGMLYRLMHGNLLEENF